MKKVKHFIIIGIFTFILMEISLFAITKFQLLNIIIPTYSMSSPEDFLPERSRIYGYRHQPNSTYEIKKNCLHTYYKFNSYGFRAKEPTKRSSKKRIVVIGDSFMEGVGVAEEERLPNLLEQNSSIKHVNFAMADKGTTQAYVIYDSIASKFEHSAILFSIFPVNDLIDDDPEMGKNENSIRPCWVGEYPNYKLEFVPKNAPSQKDYSKWKHFLKTHTYTYDALFYLKESIKEKMSDKKNYTKTGYFNYTDEQLNRMKYSLQKIKEKAKEKPLIVICIPSHLDLINTEKTQKSIEKPLSEFCSKNNIEFIGLYDFFKRKSLTPEKEFYYSCDSHWNAKGHQVVGDYLMSKPTFVKSYSFP